MTKRYTVKPPLAETSKYGTPLNNGHFYSLILIIFIAIVQIKVYPLLSYILLQCAFYTVLYYYSLSCLSSH